MSSAEKEKASEAQVKKFIEQIKELDAVADKEPDKFSTWELEYVDEQADRFDQYAEKILLSVKQVDALDKIYRKIILGEDDGQAVKKRNRAAGRPDASAS